MATFISGMINRNGQRSVGDKYYASKIADNPHTVVVTFEKAFAADEMPIGVATVDGNQGSLDTTYSIQVSNTSLTFMSSEAVPFSFIVTDRGLGYNN